MNPEQAAFLNQRHIPFRLTARQAGWLLAFSVYDIKVLTAKGYLKPVGKPAQNSTKFYSTAVIVKLQNDLKWLERATAFLNNHWKGIHQKYRKEVQS